MANFILGYDKGYANRGREFLKFLIKLQKILNKYHSEIPMIEVVRQNVLNDIDNELQLDKKIERLRAELKKADEHGT